MPFIEIITSKESESQLRNLITKFLVNNCETMYIKEENIDNIKNIKLDTIVFNEKITNWNILQKIVNNSKNVVYNLDMNTDIDKDKFLIEQVITYGYNSKSDITISSIQDEQILICLQSTIINLQNIKIEPQEIKVNVNRENVDIYDIMIIIALAIIYAKWENLIKNTKKSTFYVDKTKKW